MEDDYDKMKAEFERGQLDNKKIMEDVQGAKEQMREESKKAIAEVNEEIVVQNERIVELGLQIYSTKLYTERKFLQNAELDVRIRSCNELIKKTEEKLLTVKSKVKSHKTWMKETDLHLKKYIPM